MTRMGPLQGVKVVELSTMITAPLAGMMLADMGADVIKVERPGGGDPYRNFRGGLYSPHFCAYNRNKRSVVLDLQVEGDRDVLDRLLTDADVLLDNFRPGVLDRLGLTDDAVRSLNPRLVHCSITGFGPDGPYAERPAYDAVAQALSGMTSLQVDPADPRIAGPTIADNATGQYAAFGIVSALLERERTGVGRRVEVNMLDSAIAFIPDPFGYYTQMGLVSDPYLRAHTSQSYVFRCRDGLMLAVHLSSHEKFWREFLAAIEREDLATDPRFSTRTSRIERYEDIARLLAPVLAGERRQVWIERFAHRDIPYAPVHDVTSVGSDPQVRHLGSFYRARHPSEGEIVGIRRPIWLDGQRDDQPLHPPPTLGEHTADVLAELGVGGNALADVPTGA